MFNAIILITGNNPKSRALTSVTALMQDWYGRLESNSMSSVSWRERVPATTQPVRFANCVLQPPPPKGAAVPMPRQPEVLAAGMKSLGEHIRRRKSLLISPGGPASNLFLNDQPRM